MERTQNVNDKQTFSALSNKLLSWKDEDIDEVEVRFDWDIPDIIGSGSSGGVDDTPTEMWHPATHVVVLKDSASHNDFMATTCEEYVMRCWDSVWSRTLLELLDRFTTTTLKGSATMEERAALGERVIDLTERAAVAERAAATGRAALAERLAVARRHAQFGIPILTAGISLLFFVPPAAVGLAITGWAIATGTAVGVVYRGQRDASVERVVWAEKVALAERVALAEKAKLEEAVAKLRAASENLKFEIPHIDRAFVDLSGSMAVLYFRSLSDIRRAIDFVEAALQSSTSTKSEQDQYFNRILRICLRKE